MLYYKRAIGNSMQYLIMDGDKLLYSTNQKFAFGDIILYKDKYNGLVVSHRYYFTLFNRHITAGDNNHKFEFVYRKDIVGKAEVIIGRNSKKYVINKNTPIKKKYSKFMILFIVISYIRFRHNISYNLYKKMFNYRNKLQILYLDTCEVNDAIK